MPYVQCKHCLERQKGRCNDRKINIDGCKRGITAIDCMRPGEIREDPVPQGYRKAWWEVL